MRRVVVEIKTYAVLQFESGYDDAHFIHFVLNEGTHCVSNEFLKIAELQKAEEKPCGCRFTEMKVVGEATEADLAGDTAFNLV